MNCASCGDKGMIWLNWSDVGEAPREYAICLCSAAIWYRGDINAGRYTGYFGWQVWAAMNEIEPSRIFLIEEVLTPAELAERGFNMPAQPTLVAREAALLAAGRGKKAKL